MSAKHKLNAASVHGGCRGRFDWSAYPVLGGFRSLCGCPASYQRPLGRHPGPWAASLDLGLFRKITHLRPAPFSLLRWMGRGSFLQQDIEAMRFSLALARLRIPTQMNVALSAVLRKHRSLRIPISASKLLIRIRLF